MPRRFPWRLAAMRSRGAACLLIGWTTWLRAEDLADFPIRLPKWINEFTLRTGGGYRDNVGLSAHSPQESPFILTGAEATRPRLPEHNTRFNVFLSADDLRFLSGGTVDKEQTAFAQAMVARDWGSGWQASLAVEYVYQNQVLDVSTTEPGLTPLPVQGHGIILRDEIRHNFGSNYWVSLELLAKRQFFRQPLDDYWEYGPRIILGRSYGHKSELSVSYEIEERPYDDEELRLADGTPVPGTRRTSLLQAARFTWKHYWDAQNHWRTSTRLAASQNEDNGSGYFDFTRIQAGEQILFRTENWDISAEARATRYNYPVQTGTDLAKRRVSELLFTFRCERRVARFLKLSAEYEYNRVISNLEPEQYTVNTVKGALNWVF